MNHGSIGAERVKYELHIGPKTSYLLFYAAEKLESSLMLFLHECHYLYSRLYRNEYAIDKCAIKLHFRVARIVLEGTFDVEVSFVVIFESQSHFC